MAMSIAGILSSGLFGSSTQSTQQTTAQKLKQEFQQLGQDLQSGNLSAAQADFATLQQNAPQNSAIAGGQSTNPISQAFSQLSTDLQSGNLSAAQSDYSTIQQDFQNQAAQGPGGGHHHHHFGAGGSSSSTATGQSANPISQLFAQLGTALQAGNLSAAQTAYSTLQQDFQQFTQNGGLPGSSSTTGQSGVSGVSVTA
jgi:outer membrane protein assembly factor BamD (BamD/ComL family)